MDCKHERLKLTAPHKVEGAGFPVGTYVCEECERMIGTSELAYVQHKFDEVNRRINALDQKVSSLDRHMGQPDSPFGKTGLRRGTSI
jgi:ubiquinone biosynthesis protein UbiJ